MEKKTNLCKAKINKVLNCLVVAAMAIALLASCAQPTVGNLKSGGGGGGGSSSSGSGGTKVTITLPQVGSGLRALSSAQTSRLQAETAKYRVMANSFSRTGTGGTFTFAFPAGTKVDVTVECLNASNQPIVRTVTKSIVVTKGGDNSIVFVLSKDGTEIVASAPSAPAPSPSPSPSPTPQPQPQPQPQPAVPTVSYDMGVASDDVSKASEEKGAGSVVTLDSPVWDYGTFVEWTASVDLEVTSAAGGNAATVTAGNAINAGSTFVMPNGNVKLTAIWNATEYDIVYDKAIPTGGAQGNAQEDTAGITTFTMANNDNSGSLSTYKDAMQNWGFAGWSSAVGAATNDITNKSGIRAAVRSKKLTIDTNPQGGNDTVTLHAVWRTGTPFDITVNAAQGLSGTISGVFNSEDITQKVIDYLAGKSTSTVKYELRQGNTFTADVNSPTILLSNNNVATKVAVTLQNQLIEAAGSNLITDNDVTVTFTDPSSETAAAGKWYEVGTGLPTVSLSGANAQKYSVGSNWKTTSGQSQTQITEDMAGETIYPIAEHKVAVTVTSSSSYALGSSGTLYISQNTDITKDDLLLYKPSDTATRKFTWKTNPPTVNSGTNTTLNVDIDSYLEVENAFIVDITLDGSSIGLVQNKFTGDDITNDVKTLLNTGTKNEANNKRYTWNTGTVLAPSSTNPSVEIKAYCTVSAVKLTLSNTVINNTGTSDTFMVNIAGSDPHSGDMNKAAWYNIGTSFPNVTIYRNGNLESVGYEVSWGKDASTTYTQITDALAGETLKPIVLSTSITVKVKRYTWNGSAYMTTDADWILETVNIGQNVSSLDSKIICLGKTIPPISGGAGTSADTTNPKMPNDTFTRSDDNAEFYMLLNQ